MIGGVNGNVGVLIRTLPHIELADGKGRYNNAIANLHKEIRRQVQDLELDGISYTWKVNDDGCIAIYVPEDHKETRRNYRQMLRESSFSDWQNPNGKRQLIYRHFGDDVPREQAFVVPKGEKVWPGEYKIKHEILDHIRSSLFLRRIASWEVESNVICQASEALSGCPEIVVYNADLVGRYITLPSEVKAHLVRAEDHARLDFVALARHIATFRDQC